MCVIVNLYSDTKNEINRFLSSFYSRKIQINEDLKWECAFNNPVESADIVGVFVDNVDNFKINMWISFDKGFFINVTEYNADKIIRYLYERYPY